jgi:hypothetical protein
VLSKPAWSSYSSFYLLLQDALFYSAFAFSRLHLLDPERSLLRVCTSPFLLKTSAATAALNVLSISYPGHNTWIPPSSERSFLDFVGDDRLRGIMCQYHCWSL